MPTIEDAILLALEAHRGQVDKQGWPYILHPLRVMGHMGTHEERIVAVLHDVVEDSPTTLDDLRRMGYAEPIIAALDCLTRREDESYMEMIARIKPNPLATRVKLGDLVDHTDVRYNKPLSEEDLERLQRYQRAWWELTGNEPPLRGM